MNGLPQLTDRPAPSRTLFTPQPRRIAVFDTSVLTSDVIAAVRRGRTSGLVQGMETGVVRGFIPHQVWAEVPRVLVDRHRERGGFDLAAAEDQWWSTYIPLVRVVCSDGLPVPPVAVVVARRDSSDVGTATLTALLGPAVLLAADSDLIESGVAGAEWGRTRAAVGRVSTTEMSTRIVFNSTGWMAENLIRWIVAQVKTRPAMTIAATVAMGATLMRRRASRRGISCPGVSPANDRPRLRDQLLPAFEQMLDQYQASEAIWTAAEYTDPHNAGLLQQVAVILARADEPMCRTKILEGLKSGPGHPLSGTGHRHAMGGLDRMLHRFPAFNEAARGRWQLGRSNVAFRMAPREAPPDTGSGPADPEDLPGPDVSNPAQKR
jgi:hypothetical protein